MPRTVGLRSGDLVEVKSPDEILQTLDTNGTSDGLPFMPEMVGFSGKRFQVSNRAFKTCTSILGSTTMRAFKTGDIVTLHGLRCSGIEHDGCQKSCLIFWREAWLRKVEDADSQPIPDSADEERLRARLKTTTGLQTYFCQASELLKVTSPLTRWGRFGICVTDVLVGNCNMFEMAQRIGMWLFWRIRRAILGEYARGGRRSTPVRSLNLQPGELIGIKLIDDVIDTLDSSARNRGLYFAPDMRLFCGSQQRVKSRMDKIIVDGTGKMRQFPNTVYLEGSYCGCSHVAFGGCPRGEFSYWREIWLSRPGTTSEPGPR